MGKFQQDQFSGELNTIVSQNLKYKMMHPVQFRTHPLLKNQAYKVNKLFGR